MSVAIQFESVGKLYRSIWPKRIVHALTGLSMQVERGEIFGFLGPNGAGKTTAIHLAMGFMRPSTGRGMLLGKPFGDALTRRRVGFMAENVALYHHRTVSRLVGFYGALNGMKDPVLRRRVRDVLEMVELSADQDRNVGKFSRGMQQRVGLAQALVNDPELLILDEPTSALDPLGRVAVRELLLSASRAGKTIFLSSHLLSEVEAICDRVAILYRGELVRIGKTADLLESKSKVEIVAVRKTGADGEGRPAGQTIRCVVDAAEQRRTIERIWSEGGDILHVNPVKRSLEEVFLEMISSSAPKNADHDHTAAVAPREQQR